MLVILGVAKSQQAQRDLRYGSAEDGSPLMFQRLVIKNGRRRTSAASVGHWIVRTLSENF